MSCECNCRKFIKSVKIEVVGSNTVPPIAKVQITIPTVSLKHDEEFDLVICQSIPKSILAMPVEIVNGTSVIPVKNRNGSALLGERLFSRVKHVAVFGNKGTSHILVRNKLPINRNAIS